MRRSKKEGPNMPVEPSGKIVQSQIIRREEEMTNQQRKKQQQRKKEAEQKQPDKPGKVDIKI